MGKQEEQDSHCNKKLLPLYPLKKYSRFAYIFEHIMKYGSLSLPGNKALKSRNYSPFILQTLYTLGAQIINSSHSLLDDASFNEHKQRLSEFKPSIPSQSVTNLLDVYHYLPVKDSNYSKDLLRMLFIFKTAFDFITADSIFKEYQKLETENRFIPKGNREPITFPNGSHAAISGRAYFELLKFYIATNAMRFYGMKDSQLISKALSVENVLECSHHCWDILGIKTMAEDQHYTQSLMDWFMGAQWHKKAGKFFNNLAKSRLTQFKPALLADINNYFLSSVLNRLKNVITVNDALKKLKFCERTFQSFPVITEENAGCALKSLQKHLADKNNGLKQIVSFFNSVAHKSQLNRFCHAVKHCEPEKTDTITHLEHEVSLMNNKLTAKKEEIRSRSMTVPW